MASNSTTEQMVADFITTRSVIVFPAIALMFTFAVYGIYVVVFGLSIHIFTKRHGNLPPRLYLWGTISLFILDTTYVTFYTIGRIHQQITLFEALRTRNFDRILSYLHHDGLKTASEAGFDSATSLMIILADSILIHRCYVVWGSRRSILYPLITLSVIINGMLLGSLIPLLFAIDNSASRDKLIKTGNQVYYNASITVIVFNFILTLMTVGRIWYIILKVEKVMERSVFSRYRKIMAIVIESGILFPAVHLAVTIINILNEGIIPISSTFLSTQFSGLAPTMIVVRVAYNQPVESVQEMVSAIRFENSGQERSTMV